MASGDFKPDLAAHVSCLKATHVHETTTYNDNGGRIPHVRDARAHSSGSIRAAFGQHFREQWGGMVKATRRRRPLKPTKQQLKAAAPAALVPGVMKALGPLDPLRVRLVQDDAGVQQALALVTDAHRAVVEARHRAPASPEAAREHERAVRAHRDLVRDVLDPTIREAEAQRRRALAATPPDLAGLAPPRAPLRRKRGGIRYRVTAADRVLAAEKILETNPAWRDPLLWNATDTRRYIMRALDRKADAVAFKEPLREEKDESAVQRAGRMRREREERGTREGMMPDSPTEAVVVQHEATESFWQWVEGLCEQHDAPPDLREALLLVKQENLPFADALQRIGVPRSVFENWLDRVQRAKELQNPAGERLKGGAPRA